MPNVSVNGGDKGVRVIVDGDNENSVEVAAGTDQSFTYEGKLECRTLGIEVTGGPPDGNGAGAE